MEFDEVVRRVGVAYWPLIVALVIAGVAGAFALHVNDRPVYTSDVRFVLDAPDPRAASESGSIADTAKSIATSQSNVADALAAAGVQRDVEQFTTRNIELQPLGTSGVLDLQVKDTDPVAAAAIANALAAEVVKTRATVNESEARQLAASLTDQLKALDARIAQLEARIAGFRGGADPSVSAAALSGLYSQRTSFAQERLSIESQINQIYQSLAMRPQAGIIAAAVPASKPDPSRAPIDMALGGLGGLVLGIMAAALLATLRPRISGQREIERMLEAPVLGDFDALEDSSEAEVTARIRIAANRAGVKRVQLVPLNGSDEAINLVNVLTAKLGPGTGHASVPVPLNGNGQVITHRGRKPHSTIDVTPFDPSALSKNGSANETGLILVAPNVLAREDLNASADLLSLTGCTVAGVVTYVPRSGRRGGRGMAVRRYSERRLAAHGSGLDPLGYH